MGDYGSVYVQGSRSDYWGKNKKITNLSVGYNNSYKGVNYGINYGISRSKGDGGDWPENRQITFNMNAPLSIFSPRHELRNISSNYQVSHDSQGRTSQQLGVNGHFLDNRVSYNLTQGYENQDQGSSGTVNLGYMGNYGDVGAGYSYSRNSQSVNMNANGGMVVHSGGVTLGRSMGSSVALIEAPDADGTTLSNGNASIDRFGYAVIPYMSDYSKNTVSLNVNSLPDDVMPEKTSVNLYPTKGAVVKAKFMTRRGYQALVDLKASQPLPLGAVASIKDKQNPADINSSIVGENSQVYFSGMPEKGQIVVTWGAAVDQTCTADFDFANVAENPFSSVRQFAAACKSSH